MKPFSDAQDFHLTSDMGPELERMNYRFETIYEPVKDRIAGKRVLELGSHNGRFTWALLEHLGAKFVSGIERRKSDIEKACKSLSNLGIGPDRYTYALGDAANLIRRIPQEIVDVVVNTGFLYYLEDPGKALKELRELNPEFMVFDGASRSIPPLIEAGKGYRDKTELVKLLTAAGWEPTEVAHGSDAYKGYATGARVSFWCEPC